MVMLVTRTKQLDFIVDGLTKVKVEVLLAKLIDTIRYKGKDSLLGIKDTNIVTDPIRTPIYNTKKKANNGLLDFWVGLEKPKISLSGHYNYNNRKLPGGIPEGKSLIRLFRKKNNLSILFM